MSTNIILHYSKNSEYSAESWLRTIKSVFEQTVQNFCLTIISDTDTSEINEQINHLNSGKKEVVVVAVESEQQSAQLAKAVALEPSDFHLYIDNRTQEVVLKKSALELCVLAMKNSRERYQ